MGVFEYIFNNEYYGYYLDYSEGEACSEDYTKCKLAISSTDEAYKTVNIKYVYEKYIQNNATTHHDAVCVMWG